jgi:hypothetical protein
MFPVIIDRPTFTIEHEIEAVNKHLKVYLEPIINFILGAYISSVDKESLIRIIGATKLADNVNETVEHNNILYNFL